MGSPPSVPSNDSLPRASKPELQAELQNARPGGTGHFAVSDILIAVAGSARSGGAAAENVDAAPLRMVEGVVAFRPELHSTMLTPKPWNFKILHQSQIPVIAPRARQSVFADVAEHPRFVVCRELRDRNLSQQAGIKPGGRGTEFRIVHRSFF